MRSLNLKAGKCGMCGQVKTVVDTVTYCLPDKWKYSQLCFNCIDKKDVDMLDDKNKQQKGQQFSKVFEDKNGADTWADWAEQCGRLIEVKEVANGWQVTWVK